MISRRGLESATAALTGAFGLAVAVSSFENGVTWTSSGGGAGTFPFINGLIIVAASAYNFVHAGVLRGSRARVIGWGDLKKLAALFLPALGLVAAIPILGMHLASAVYIFAVLVPQHHVSVWRALAIAVVTAIALYGLFDRAFQVQLPRGLLGAALGF
jgi:Tripartite tricarboxylate transporter TctB family